MFQLAESDITFPNLTFFGPIGNEYLIFIEIDSKSVF